MKAITVGGVEPTEETVLDGSYAIQRNFNFIVSDSTPLSEAAQAFVDFATSADASDLIAARRRCAGSRVIRPSLPDRLEPEGAFSMITPLRKAGYLP